MVEASENLATKNQIENVLDLKHKNREKNEKTSAKVYIGKS